MGDVRKPREDVERGSIEWRRGHKLVGGAVDDRNFDLRVMATRTKWGTRFESGWLTMRLEPATHRVRLANGAEVEVQSFRCWRPQGEERFLTVCAACGDLMFGSAEDVREAAAEGCRCCGASVEPAGCRTPHTFGTCLHCPCSDPSQLPMFVPAGARVQSDPATKAGPATNPQEPAGERRVVAVGPDGYNEVDVTA